MAGAMMRKRETKFYSSRVKPFLNSLKECRHNRIESSASPGFPDIDVTYIGKNYKIELKAEDDKGRIHIRPAQKNWHKKELRAGGNCFFLILLKDRRIAKASIYNIEDYKKLIIKLDPLDIF
jgi:hypothetical protein